MRSTGPTSVGARYVIIDAIVEDMAAWVNRLLDRIYPVI